ncbi:GPR1/FUN34/YaaH-class plasma membrane protein-like protein [Xylariaceae sp. FL0016]|nr:GPR1/FUN34/YaaH-class plasma membrane protein-like protein [Xylariaceae sp. FL0016]
MEDHKSTNGYGDGDEHIKHEHLSEGTHPDVALKRLRTAGSISLSPELFEKLYLAPQNKVKGELRKTFANPTPIAIVGFILSLGPFSCDLMGWRGAGGSGAASIPEYLYFGGVLMILGGIFEFLLGNTFPCVVFVSFGAFWLSFGSTLIPQFNAYAAYAPTDATSSAVGLQTQGFNASFGFFTLSMMLLCLVYLVCSVRTNIAFVIVFFFLVLYFGLVTGYFWTLAQDFTGNAAYAGRLLKAAGACAFVTTCAGWWIFLALLLASVDFPFALPVGDLSTTVRGASDRKTDPV